jgi:signal transduction histidine kinase
MGGKSGASGPFPSPPEAETPGPGAGQAETALGELTLNGLFYGSPARATEVLERCFAELVRYYRHSSAGRSVSGIVHQMNTPLQVLSFHLELLEQDSQEELEHLPPGPGLVTEKLQARGDYRLEKIRQFRQELAKLQALARRLLLKGVHEDHEDKSSLDLNQIYQEELELYLAQPFFQHRVEKDFHFQSLPPILGHYLDFSQSFRNLVDNALEAMEGAARRKLTIETCLLEGVRVLRLGDTGVGIPLEILPRLFAPFFTTKGTPEKPRAGLGLFMARRLLTLYGGQIRIESQPGETWVTVRLPVAGR